MQNTNTSFTGAIPENYEAFMGPMLFEPYAKDMAQRIKKLQPQSLLEIACGTGRLTKYLPEVIGSASIIASDVSAAMIEYSKAKYPGLRVAWDVADAMNLQYGDASFDCVAEQFGIMFCKDKLKALRETYRMLRYDGVFIFSAWDKLEKNPVMHLCDLVMPEFFPVDTPDFFKIPYSYNNTDTMQKDLQAVGFREIEIENVLLKGERIKAADAAAGIAMGTPMYNAIMNKAPELLQGIRKKYEATIRENLGDEFEASLSAFVVTAKK